MRRLMQILTVISALAAPYGMAEAQTLDAAKIANINKAADSFLALAKDSHATGQPPRYSDPAVKPLLDTVFDTKQIEGQKPLPWTEVQKLNDWSKAATRVGLVYYLAGTGTKEVNVVAKDPKLTVRANQNTVTFAPEFGRYYDAQINLQAAMINTASAQVLASTPEQRKDPEFRKTLNNISDNAAKSVIGLLHTLALEGLPDDWQFLRVALLLKMTPQAAKFLAPDDRQLLRNAAAEAADQVKNPDVKSGVNAIARAFATF
jgi:hypothetical protein